MNIFIKLCMEIFGPGTLIILAVTGLRLLFRKFKGNSTNYATDNQATMQTRLLLITIYIMFVGLCVLTAVNLMAIPVDPSPAIFSYILSVEVVIFSLLLLHIGLSWIFIAIGMGTLLAATFAVTPFLSVGFWLVTNVRKPELQKNAHGEDECWYFPSKVLAGYGSMWTFIHFILSVVMIIVIKKAYDSRVDTKQVGKKTVGATTELTDTFVGLTCPHCSSCVSVPPNFTPDSQINCETCGGALKTPPETIVTMGMPVEE